MQFDFSNCEWTDVDYQEFRNFLFENSEEGYRDFVLSGIITERPLLGVRVPKCREIGKMIVRGNPKAFLKHKPISFEEVQVRAFVVANLPYPEMMKEIDKQIELIDNWEICDTFCAGCRKNVERNKEVFLDKIDELINSLDEFKVRAGFVFLLDFYVTDGYLSVIFDRINEVAEYLSDGAGEMSVERIKGERGGKKVRDVMAWDAYYVKMAIAWLISVCFAKFPEETMEFFKQVKLPKWTYNKTIAKTRESYRVDRSLKDELLELRMV